MANPIDDIDPDLRAFFDTPRVSFSTEALPEMRRLMSPAMRQMLGAAIEPVAVQAQVHEIAAPDATQPLKLFSYRPEACEDVLPAILHVHGGGFVLYGAEDFAPVNAALAHTLHCAVFSVDYPLAPEAPFPAAVEACYRALTFLHQEAGALRIDAKRIGVKGESAGGGLAAALALLARDRGGPQIAFQHLMYPMLDDRTLSDPFPIVGWAGEHNRFGWTALLGAHPGGTDVSAYAAPARALDLSRLPPTYIAVGARDLFAPEDMAYAQRLALAGVPVELHVYPGAPHGFDLIPGAGVAKRARACALDALRRFLA